MNVTRLLPLSQMQRLQSLPSLRQSKTATPQPTFSGAPPTDSVVDHMSPSEVSRVRQYGTEYKGFLRQAVTSSWTTKTLLDAARKQGFQPFPTNGEPVKPGEKYYFNNDYESLALVVIGTDNPIDSGFNIVGAHTDSPQLELKADTVKETNNLIQLKTKYRGGAINLTWFQQPLGIAGRVFESVPGRDGRPKLDPKTHLPIQRIRWVRITTPILIPIEAIHLNREINQKRDINMEEDLNPLVATSRTNGYHVYETVKQNVIETLKAKGIDLTKASRAELTLYPIQGPVDIGFDKSMILAQAHDDRSMCFASFKAIIEASNTGKPPLKTSIAYYFNNEETGSLNRGGATSRWPETVAGKIAASHIASTIKDPLVAREAAFANSLIISADAAHATFPAHAQYHDAQNAVHLGRGPAIKDDSNGRYATTRKGSAMIQDIATLGKVPIQIMNTRQNVPCGTTIGPMLAAGTNAETVDMGAPIISMHASGELGATVDFYLTKELFRHFMLNTR